MINEKKLLVKGGSFVAVIRPSDPQRALAKAKALVARGSSGQQDMNDLLKDPEQTYTFVGLVTKKNAKIVDPQTGVVIDKLQPGDSFVSYKDLLAQQPSGAPS